MIKFSGYTSRWEFILNKCRDKKVLHLGCIGITEGSLFDKLEAMRNGFVIHAHIRRVAREILGIDYDLETVKALNKLGYLEIVYGDATKLNELQIEPNIKFDVIVAGDLIEHLSNPRDMLVGVRRFMNRDSEVIITTPNAFGGLHFVRYVLSRYREGNDHILSFNIYTLSNLLERYGFKVSEAWTCYNHPPFTYRQRVKYSLGIPVFKVVPKLGGTLCVVARLSP